MQSLEKCAPSSKDLTWWDKKSTEFHLGWNDYFATMLPINGNTQSIRWGLYVLALKLKTDAKCIYFGSNEDAPRAATYTYLALGSFD